MTNRTPSSETPDVLRPATESSMQAARQPFVVKPYPAFSAENPALQVSPTQKIPSAVPPTPPGNLDNPLATPLARLETIANAAEGQMIAPIQPGVPAFAPGDPPQSANVQRMEMPTQTIPSIQQVLQGMARRNAQQQAPTLQQLQQATYPTQNTPRYAPPMLRVDPVIKNAEAMLSGQQPPQSANPEEEMRLDILRNLPLINSRGILSPDDLRDRSVGQATLPPATPPQSLGAALGGITGSMQAQRDRYRDIGGEDRRGDSGAMNRVTQGRTNQSWTDWIGGMIQRGLSGIQQSFSQLGSPGAQSLLNPVQAIPNALREAQAAITGQVSPELQRDREQQAQTFQEFLPPQIAAPAGTQTLYPWDAGQQPTRSLADYTRGGSNFGDYGTGAVGAGLFLANLPQAFVMAPLYTVTDNLWRLGSFISGQPQPTHLNLPDGRVGPVTVPGWLRSWVGERRARQFFLEGVDPSVTNQRDNDRYLGILSYAPDTPQWVQAIQFGTGLAIDTLMLGSMDNAVLAGPRTAAREARQALTNRGILPRLPDLPNNGTVIMNRVPQMPVPQQGGLIARTNAVHQQYYAPGVAPNYVINQPIQIPAIPQPTAQTLPTIPPIQTGGLSGTLSLTQLANPSAARGAVTGAAQGVGVNVPRTPLESLRVVSPSDVERTANAVRDLQRRRIARQEFNAQRPSADALNDFADAEEFTMTRPSDDAINDFADGQEPQPPGTGARVTGQEADALNQFADAQTTTEPPVDLELLPGGARDFYDLFTEETQLEGILDRTPEQEARLQEVKGQLNGIAEAEESNVQIIERFRNLEQEVQQANYRPGGASSDLIQQYEQARNAFVNLNRGDRSGDVVPFTRSDGTAVLQPVRENPQSNFYFRPRLANEFDRPAPQTAIDSDPSVVRLQPRELPGNVVDMTYGRNRRNVTVGANTNATLAFNTLNNVLSFIDELFAENADLLARYSDDVPELPVGDATAPARLDRTQRMYNDNVRSFQEGNGIARVELNDGTIEEVPIAQADELYMRHTQPRIEWSREGVSRASQILEDPDASDVYYNDAVRTLDDGLPSDPSLLGLDEDGVVRPTTTTPTPQQTVAAAVIRGDIVQTPSGSIITRNNLEKIVDGGDVSVSPAQIEAARAALDAMPSRVAQPTGTTGSLSAKALQNVEANSIWFKTFAQVEDNSMQLLLASKGLTEADLPPGVYDNYKALQEEYIRANDEFFRAELAKGTTPEELNRVRENLNQVQKRTGIATINLEQLIDRLPGASAPDAARVAELQQVGNTLSEQLDRADAVVKQTGNAAAAEEVNAFDRVSPVIKPQSLSPAVSTAQLDDIATRVDPTQPLPQQIRRSNADLTRLAQSMMDDNGKPLVSPKRKTPLRSSDIDKLNQRFPGMFDRYGEPIPTELSHPMARVDLGNGETALMAKPDPDAEGTVKLTNMEQVVKATNEVAPPEFKAETPEQLSMRMAKEGLEIEYAAQAAEVSRLEVEVNTLQSRIAIVESRYNELLPYTRGDLNSSLATREMSGFDPNSSALIRNGEINYERIQYTALGNNYRISPGSPEKMQFSNTIWDTPQWYHGSLSDIEPNKFTDIEPHKGAAVDNELGMGVYVTTNPKLAQIYARASSVPTQPLNDAFAKTDHGYVYSMKFRGRTVLDADLPAEPGIRNLFKQVAKSVFAEYPEVARHYSQAIGRGVKTNSGLPMKQYWLQIRESFGDVMQMPPSEALMQEFMVASTEMLGRAGVDGTSYALKDGTRIMAIYSNDIGWQGGMGNGRIVPVGEVRRMALDPVPDPVLNARNARLQAEGFLHENIDTNVTRARLAEADLAHKNELLSRARQNYEREVMTGLETTRQLGEVESRMLESIDRHNINTLNNNSDAAKTNAPNTLRKFDGPTDSPCV